MKLFFQILLPLLILTGGGFTYEYLSKQKKERKKKTPESAIPIVETQRFKITDHPCSINSFGVIEAYDSTPLVSQLSGKIVSLHKDFRVGNILEKGALLAEIEKADFLSIVTQRDADLMEARCALEEEKVMGKQAKEDWVASGRKLEGASSFVLREPQLAAAKANVLSAEGNLEKAKIDLQRTKITVPFTSIVTEKSVSEGRYITSQTVIGTLVNSAIAEVPLSLIPAQLKRIQLSELPLEITIIDPQRPEVSKAAKITRVSPSIDSASQSTSVIAEIDDPYEAPYFPIGTFVNAQIPAGIIEATLAIPESAFINNDFFWALRADKLKKINAESVFSKDGLTFLKVKDSQETSFDIILRPLTSFREEMTIRRKGEQEAPKPSEKKAGRKKQPKS